MSTRATITALLVGACSACGGAAGGAPVITLAIPVTSATSPTIVAPSSESPRGKQPQFVDPMIQRWEGQWVDPATRDKTRMTIVIRNGVPTVVRSVESVGDKEEYKVQSSSWQDGTLTWSHYVPSTEYLVTYVCTDIQDDALVCRWSNDHNAAGKENLPRVKNQTPDGPNDVEEDP